jgi:hypothetical protein
MEPPAEMSSIEPVDPPASSLTPATSPPEPTPLLDAALERAKGLDKSALDDAARAPAPIPVPEARVELPSPAPEPLKPEPILIAMAPTPIPTPEPDPSPPKPEAKEPEPPRPEEIWREGVRRLSSLARAKSEQSGDSPGPWGLRARVLAWLAEPEIDPDLGQREADSIRAVLRALDDIPTRPNGRGDEVRSAVLVLEDRAPLEVVDLRLCSKVERFGDFEPFEPPVRKAGQDVILYCELDGVRFESTPSGHRSRIAAKVEILAEGGGQPILSRAMGTAEETCRRRRRDYYVAYKLVLPRTLAPGDYRIRLTETDLTSDRTASREVAFAIAKD